MTAVKKTASMQTAEPKPAEPVGNQKPKAGHIEVRMENKPKQWELALVINSRNMKKLITLTLTIVTLSLNAEPSAKFWRGLHHVENESCSCWKLKNPMGVGVKHDYVIGDGGRSLGPLQIKLAYWKDAKVKGKYSDCSDLAYSITVAKAYMKRWAPKAYKAGDHRALARIHNGGGPNGRKMSSTIKYWNKVRKEMK